MNSASHSFHDGQRAKKTPQSANLAKVEASKKPPQKEIGLVEGFST
jgi:hypothetical protein